MICEVCRSIADHPSNTGIPHDSERVNLNYRVVRCPPTCSCQHGSTAIPVEKLYDPYKVDLEWVRTRRTTVYSKQETAQ